MKFDQQLDKLVKYFKQGETNKEQIGIEVEHFVVDKEDLKAVNYEEDGGIEDLLYQLYTKTKNWNKIMEGEHLVGLTSNQANITLEPGGQVEIGINPYPEIKIIQEIYSSFLKDFIPILKQNNYYLLTLGYQVESKIKDIPFNPKKRYKIMAEYLKDRGKYSHNMMKGTSALQIALDYKTEEDFIKKFRTANILSPVMAGLFDNGPIFEGEIYDKEALRTLIWNHTDSSRTGIVKGTFTDDFGYQKYAEYILTREPILLKTGGEYLATGNKTCREIFKEKKLGRKELEHILTMVFPDVRAKQFIEIRMTDSVPPDLTWALVAFWKGLFYAEDSLDKMAAYGRQFSLEDILKAKEDIILKGLNAKIGSKDILTVAHKAVNFAEKGLSREEINYLNPLKEVIKNKLTPAQKIKRKLKEMPKRQAVKGNILNFWDREDN